MSKCDKEKLDFEEDEEKQDPVALGGDADDNSDDEEANEDLSLKILEKALSRRPAERVPNYDVSDYSYETRMVDLCAPSYDMVGFGLVHGETAEILKEEDRVEKKKQKIELETLQETLQDIVTKEKGRIEMVEELTTDEKAETARAKETIEPMDQTTVGISDNRVLRKLLRGPRYFDPPDSSWDTCYNCGEHGHMAVNCPSITKRKKPCFVCGSLEHGGKRCAKALDCFICKKHGHRAKDCPDKYKSGSKGGNICLRCGDSGHNMFSCRSEYSYDDLKDIQCYVCRSFGHLSCVNPVNSSPQTVSCYKCGQMGHSGLTCGRLKGETTGKESPSSCFRCGGGGHFARECPNSTNISDLQGRDSPSSCYRCGEEGHFARQCRSSTRIRKSNSELPTPTLKHHRKNKDQLGCNSAPVELGG